MSDERRFLHEDDSPMTALLKRSSDGIVIVDTSGVILFVNPAAAAIFGRRYEELVGSNLGLPLLSGEKAEIDILNKQQGLRRVEMMTSETRWYEQPVRLVVFHDITREVEAEKQRRISEKKFTEIFRISPEPVLLTRLEDGTILDANPAFLAALDMSRDECIGKTTVEIGLWAAQDERETFLQEAQERGQIHRREVSLTVAGEKYTFLVSSTLIEIEGESNLLTLLRDITSIRERQQHLEYAKQEAERANRAKSDFLANMSHEIRTPMNAIIGSSHILMNTSVSPEQKEFINTIIQSGNHLLTLIDDILDFSKIEAGKLYVENELFDMDEIAKELLDIVSHRARGKTLELVYHFNPQIERHLYGDPARLRQILVNLVGNAVKFTPRGEVVIREVLKERSANSLTLGFEISDTGIGISSERIQELFSPFSQGDTSATRRYGGTGLGLSIVKRLSELMGGSVTVESTEDVGSRFTVTLPFTFPESYETAPFSTEITLEELRGTEILIVEDNASSRAMLSDILTYAGAVCTQAEELAQARRLIREEQRSGHRYRLVLLDESLSGEYVYDFTGELKQSPGGENIDVVLMPGLDSFPDRRHYAQYGYSALVPKPVKRKKLLSILSRLAGGFDGTATHPHFPQEAPENTAQGIADRQAGIAGAHADTASSTDSAYRSSPSSPSPSSSLSAAEQANSVYRILIAEDNAINRDIAVRSLEKLGYTVESADDGEAAMRSALKRRYDLIFMDVQMPGMDGYEATSRIRTASSGNTPPDVPIIAMTAHTSKQDRDRCLAAGMNDYLSKPVKPERLTAALSQWLPTREKAAAHGAPSRAGSKEEKDKGDEVDKGYEEPEIFDLSAFRETTHNDEEHMQTLFAAFVRDVPIHIQEIREKAGKEKWAKVASLAHAVKGVAMTFTMPRLEHTAAALEQSARTFSKGERPHETEQAQDSGLSSEEKLYRMIETLEQEYRAAEESIRKLISSG